MLVLASLFSLTGCGTYNRLVTLEQTVNKKWADVQSVYQRRADLIPNLVSTVAGAANFEKSTLTEVTNARASVGQVKLDPSKAPTDAAELEKFQKAQGQLSTALSRLLVVLAPLPVPDLFIVDRYLAAAASGAIAATLVVNKAELGIGAELRAELVAQQLHSFSACTSER